MAIYSLCTTPFSRSAGTSAIAKAAYRAGERLLDRFYGEVCNYTRKAGVAFKEIFCPNDQKIDRQDLWNLAEAAEKRKDARTAREIRIALPHELSDKERENLAVEFAQGLVKKYGIAVDLCIHLPDEKGDQRNHHAHLLLTTRQLTLDGLSEKSDLEKCDKDLKKLGKLSTKKQLIEIRESWENLCNLALERHGLEERISAKSYKERNIDQEPTIHLGPAVTAMERKGIETDKGTWNRIIEKNNLMRILQKEMEQLEINYRKFKTKIVEIKNKLIMEIRSTLTPEPELKPEPKTLTQTMNEKSQQIPDKSPTLEDQRFSLTDALNQRQEEEREQEIKAAEERKLTLTEKIELEARNKERGLNRDQGGLER